MKCTKLSHLTTTISVLSIKTNAKKEEIESKDNECKENELNESDSIRTNETEHISQLTDVTCEEMCKKGHGKDWKVIGMGQNLIGDNKCIQCGSVKDRKFCVEYCGLHCW